MAAKFREILSDIAHTANLKIRGPLAFGLYKGYLIALKDFSQTSQFVIITTFPRKEDTPRIEQNLDRKALLKIVNAMGQLHIEPGVVVLTFSPKWKTPEISQVRDVLDTMINVLSANTPPFKGTCDQCNGTSPDVVLLNGIPALKCNSCTEKIRREVEAVHTDWYAKKPNYKKGLTYSLLAVFISAFAWALIAYVFMVYFFYAGFIIGLFIGFTLAYGTEKITAEVIALAVVLTLFAVILGEILYVAFLLAGNGISLAYLPEEFGFYISEYGGEFAGAILTGLIGAGLVAYNLYSQGKVQAPEVDLVT